jgi:uncharacterized protein GlcG (DUF336 family)
VAFLTSSNDRATGIEPARALTLAAAERAIAAARARATELGVPMNVAIVDQGGNLVAFARMDGAWLGSIDIAQNKAYTARAFDMPTKDLAPLVQPGQSLYGIEASNRGRLIVFGGGIPLVSGGSIVGAIGVSGGAVEQDQSVAEAGVAAFDLDAQAATRSNSAPTSAEAS